MLAINTLPRSPTTFLAAALGEYAPLRRGQEIALQAVQPLLALPFDTLRQHYAVAVVAGLVPRSLLHSAWLERWLLALEALTLGPLARCR